MTDIPTQQVVLEEHSSNEKHLRLEMLGLYEGLFSLVLLCFVFYRLLPRIDHSSTETDVLIDSSLIAITTGLALGGFRFGLSFMRWVSLVVFIIMSLLFIWILNALIYF